MYKSGIEWFVIVEILSFDIYIDMFAGFYVYLNKKPVINGLAQILMNIKKVESYQNTWKHQKVRMRTIKEVIKN